jgi:membrane protein YdbS with pleckstrin-like domain
MSAPAAAPMAGPPPRGGETVLWQDSPSLKLLLVQGLRTLIIALAAVAAAIVIQPVAAAFFADLSAGRSGRGPRDSSPATFILVAVIGAYLMIRVVSLSMAILQLRNTRYKVTDQRVVVERGILSRALEEIDLRYVDDSGFSQSPLERLQGIGTVWLISSDKSMPRLQLRGIKDPRAIREMIREQAYRMSQGQLFTRST